MKYWIILSLYGGVNHHLLDDLDWGVNSDLGSSFALDFEWFCRDMLLFTLLVKLLFWTLFLSSLLLNCILLNLCLWLSFFRSLFLFYILLTCHLLILGLFTLDNFFSKGALSIHWSMKEVQDILKRPDWFFVLDFHGDSGLIFFFICNQ